MVNRSEIIGKREDFRRLDEYCFSIIYYINLLCTCVVKSFWLSQEEFVLYQFIFRSVARAEIRLLLLFLLGLGDYRYVSGEFRLATGYRLSCKFDTGGY